MLRLLLIIIFAGLNRLRGWGPADADRYAGKEPSTILRLLEYLTSKYVVAIAAGLVCWAFERVDVYGALIITAGYALWAAPGWGDYFDFLSADNKEISWIDSLVSKLGWNADATDMVSMTLRGFGYGYPLFVVLALYTGDLGLLASGCALLLQGAVYYGCYRWKNGVGHTAPAEWIMGGIWGVMLV